MEPEEMIEMILAWAEDKPFFDISFVEGLQEDVVEKGRIFTDAQIRALENIIEKWDIK